MSKLLNIKEWVSLSDAARYLGMTIKEDVAEADILRLALDGHLLLSVNFVNPVWARLGTIVPITDFPLLREQAVFELLDPSAPIELRGGAHAFVPGDEVCRVIGVLDLPMIGPEVAHIEMRYQTLTGGPQMTELGYGPLVKSEGDLRQLVRHRSSLRASKETKFKEPWEHPDNFIRAGWFTNDGLLVVRTRALHECQARIMGSASPVHSPELGTRERDTLLKLVIGMAMSCYKIGRAHV